MAFQSLISGAECNVSANPLAQVLKHTEGDRSLQKDRIAGPSSSSLRQSSVNGASDHDIALARQFFDGSQQQQIPLGPDPSTFLLSSHPAEQFRQQGIHSGIFGAEVNEAWKMEQQRSLSTVPGIGLWTSEFSSSSALYNAGPLGQQRNAPIQTESQRALLPSYAGSAMTMHNMGWSGAYATNYKTIDQEKGKGKGREIDFEAAFEQVTASLASTQLGTSRIEEIKSDTIEAEEENYDFDQLWGEVSKSSFPPEEEDRAKWEAEYNQFMSSQRDEHEYGAFMQEAWEHGLGNFSVDDQSEQYMQFDDEGIPTLQSYVFEKDNKYMDPSRPGSLLQDAKALLEMNGSLSEAALMLEAAIQNGELGEGGYEAWILLGDVRTMDEREEAGMRAIMEGVRLAEAAGKPGPGMLSLAISFTNESYNKASHIMLLRWLRAMHSDYPVPEETIQAMKTHSTWDTHSRMTDLFIGLARTQHSQGVLDADVQVALGVLFYTNGEYERAKDCFEAALSVRPKDYLLWNRLGSALSNGHKPEESLGAYREALNLRPTYTRAIHNVGVACLNIGAYKESAEHFLSALSLQEATNGDTSEGLWLTLRRAFEAMERPDLVEIARLRSSLDVFRREGFDF